MKARIKLLIQCDTYKGVINTLARGRSQNEIGLIQLKAGLPGEKNPKVAKLMKVRKIVAFLPAQMLEKALRLQFEQCSQPGDCGRSGEMGGKHQSTTFPKLSILSFAVFLKSHFG